jgi:hypothetical protein
VLVEKEKKKYNAISGLWKTGCYSELTQLVGHCIIFVGN